MKVYEQMWKTIAEDIKEDIINGHYKSQDRLKEAELAAKYSASKTPVREALRYLESIGFVEIFPHITARLKNSTSYKVSWKGWRQGRRSQI